MHGNKPFVFGAVEKKVALNWASLLTSLAIAVVSWAGVELVPQLQEYGGVVGVVAGVTAQFIPIVVMYLRNNKNVVIEPKTPEKDSSQ